MTPGGSLHDPRSFETSLGLFFGGATNSRGDQSATGGYPPCYPGHGIASCSGLFWTRLVVVRNPKQNNSKTRQFFIGFFCVFFGWRSRVEISKVQQLWYRCIGWGVGFVFFWGFLKSIWVVLFWMKPQDGFVHVTATPASAARDFFRGVSHFENQRCAQGFKRLGFREKFYLYRENNMTFRTCHQRWW